MEDINNKNSHTIEKFGCILILVIVFFFFLSKIICPHETAGNECSIGLIPITTFLILPLSLVGSLGTIISAIILKRRKIIFTGLQKFFLIISVLFIVLLFCSFGYIAYVSFDWGGYDYSS